MKKLLNFKHLLVFCLAGTTLLTGCSGSSGSAIDALFGSTNSAPILTSIPDQTVAQTDLLHIDINNIKEGQPGNDKGMSYACYYDIVVDGIVDTTNSCSTIPNSTVTFNNVTGELDWTPGTGILGDYEIRIVGSNSDGVYSEIFSVGVRLKFNGIENITSISGTSVTLTWTPNASATGYQVFKLNTLTGLYEHLWTVNGGSNSGTTVTGLVPNTPFTVRVQSVDIHGHFDGNVVSRSFTTTSLVRFSMAASSTTVTAGTSTTITVQAYNADSSPQTVGGLAITPNIAGGTSVGAFSAVTDNNDGTYTFTFSPTVVGTPAVLEISTNMTFFLQNNVTVTVNPGPASSANSTISISSNSIVSGQTATVSATIRDAYMNTISSGSTIAFVGSGGTSTGTFGAVNNLGNGQYSAVFTGITAGTAKNLFVQVDASVLTPSTAVTVIPGTPTSINSTLAVSAGTVQSGNAVTVTATLRDINNNPVPSGILVTFNKSGGTSTGTYSAVVNAGNGQYTVTYTGLATGTAQTLSVSVDGVPMTMTQTIQVIPGNPYPANSTLTISSGSITSGSFATVTATIRDVNNNPIESGITVTFSKTGGTSTGTFTNLTNQGLGVYTVRYNGIVAGTAQTLQVLVNGSALGSLSTTVAVNPGSPSPTQSTISVASSTVISGANVLVTAVVRDDNNNPISSGYSVAFSKTGGTSTGTFSAVTNAGSGTYTVQYNGAVAGTAQTLGISIDGSPLGPTTSVSVLPGAPSTSLSTFTVTSSTVTSGQSVTLTGTIKDDNNNPISSGITVAFSAVAGGTSTGNLTAIVNQGSGVYTATFTGITAGTAKTYNLTINGSQLGSLANALTVVPASPSAAQSTISIASGTVTSGASVLVTAVIRDLNNNPISSGYSVAFSKTGGTSTGTFSAVTNAGSGTYTVQYTGVVAGSAQTLGITIDTFPLGPTTSVSVIPGAPSNLLSTFTVSSGTVIAGQSVTLTATIRDANSNPISSGILVGFDQIGGGTSFGNIGATVNQGNGVYTATYAGVTAGTAKTVQTNVAGGGFGPTQSIQVLVGAPYAANSSISFATSPLASGNSGTISATIRDSQNNPITTEYAITFDAIGGSSTGTIGATSNLGSGQFQASYTAAIAGSAQTLRVLADSVPISGLTTTVQVIPGPVDVTNSTFITSASTVQSGTTANFTIQLKDVNNNSISGATVTFNKTAGVSNGNITGATHTSNGNYPAVYTATTQGTAQTITLVVNGTAIPAMAVSVTVTSGPPASIAISGPSNPLNSIDCNGPYTVTLKDAANNTTSSLTTVNVSLSSSPVNSHSGTIFSDSSCVAGQTGLSLAPLQSSTSFYYKSYLPQSLTLTLTPSGGISANSVSLQNVPVISYIGSAATFTMNGSGNGTVFDDRGGGLWGTYGVSIRGDYMFAVDSTGNRILKYNINTNTFIGWIGHIGSIEGISAGCSGNVIGDLTNTWCTGGRSSPGTSTILYQPRGITSDATYIYVSSNNRVLRFRQDDGSYQGWIGRVNTVIPPAGGQLATCVGPTTSTGTPGWCLGGNFTSGTGDAQFNTPADLSLVSGKLYVTDYNNHRIQKFDATTGAFEGWIGRVLTVPTAGAAGCTTVAIGDPTPGWCRGGTAQASNRYNLQVSPTETTAPPEGFYNPMAIDGNTSYLYIGDYNNRRIVRINTTTGVFSGWIGRIYRGNSAANTTSPVAGNSIYSPDWTTAGTTQEVGGTTGFCAPTGVRIDNTYIYITDTCHRVVRVDIADGQNYRWVGRVTSSPTGGFVGCSSTPISGVTPGWCLGGAGNRVGNANLAFYNPQGLAYSGNTLYIADLNNFRIQKMDLTTGEFAGWIGAGTTQARTWNRTPAAQYARGGIDDYSVADVTGAWAGIAISGNHLFTPDIGVHRIKRFNKLDGSIVGYIGQINVFPPTGPDECIGYTSGMTPFWCTGGGRTTNGTGIHGYYNPYGVATDGTYVYVANNANERVDRVRISDALYMGWIGRINAIPTDGDTACLTANTGDPAPGWCVGGTASAGTGDGMFSGPRNLYYDSAIGKLFVVGNGKLSKINPSTGAFEGVIGHITAGTGCTITTNVPSGWCTAATGNSGTNGYGGLNNGTAIATNSTYIFVADTGNYRIHRYVKSTGAPAGFLGRLQNATNLDVSVGTGMACAGLTGVPAYPKSAPGWCKGTSIGVALTVPGVSTDEGSFNSPRGIWANDSYVYVADTGNNRLVRLDANTGTFAGWKGYIASTAGMTGSCLAAGVGAITPTWCTGGLSGPATTLGGFDFPTGLAGDTNYLYVQDGRNNRIVTIPIN